MPVLITGTIRFHGKPVKGATVKLYADPLQSILHKVKVNHLVPDALIGKTTTGPKGGYAIPLTAAALRIMRARAVRGVVNLHVLAYTHKNGTAHWFPKVVSLHKLAAGAAVPSLATPQVINLTLPDEYTPPSGQKHPSFNFAYCGRRYPMYQGQPQWTIVGATYSNMKAVQMLYTYERGQGTILGVAFSPVMPWGVPDPGANPLGVTFTQTSTVAWNSSITEPYNGHSGVRNDQYSTRFIYGEFITTCAGITVQPVNFAGGNRDVRVHAFYSANKYCSPQGPVPNQPVVITNSKATNYSAGVSISGLIGINLSAETDHDSSSTLQYTFPKGGWLCGTTGYPGGTASNNTIYAGKARQ